METKEKKILLACHDVSLGYERKPLLEHLDFTVYSGDYVAVLGENGSGKSTLLKSLLGLTPPLAGRIDRSAQKAGQLGYLPQQTPAQRDFPATAEEVVLSGFLNRKGFRLTYSNKEKSAALMHMGKLGILELKDKCYRELSGGQQQRVLLCRALCAANDVHYVGWPFISLKYDFAEKRPQGVGGIGQKLALTASFGGRLLAISPDQEGVSSDRRDVEVRAVTERTLRQIAEDVAFYHLRSLQPSNKVQFKSVDPEILAPRRKLARKLFELANDEDVLNDTGTFVVLFGGPGMGKSVLMWLLRERCTTSHRAIGYVCQAGRANQGWEFVKSLAYGIASTFGEETGELLSVDIPDTPPKGDALRDAYRNLVVNPLRRISRRFNKKEKLFVLVDGLDEDATGVVADLLLDGDLKLPPKIAVVVSSRHIVQDEDRLESAATEILDLDEQDTECARDVRMDVRTYIDQWLLTNESVNNWLMQESLASEEVKDAILDKDRSFLYASYVLSGIADGRYGVRKEWDKPITISYFAENLPADLKTCFYDAFKARFPDGRSYGKVKPLLRQLVRKGRIGEADASRKAVVGEVTLGAVLKALRGYAVVTDGEISLSSEALRMWLGDSTHNAEFGV